MTEQSPNHGNDDETQRTPGSTDDRTAGTSHRYGAQAGRTPDRPDPHVASPSPAPAPASGDTARFGFGFADRTEQAGPVRTRPSRPSGGVVAALLAAALVVGGLGGLAGGAGFTAVDDLVGGGSGSQTSSAGSTSSPVVAHKDVAPAADSVESVARAVLPSVVKINVKGQQGEGSGSGIVISSDGEILTNNHVAAVAGQGGEISVNFNDGSAKKATVVGTDPLTDLAVIKAEGVSGLQPATIATSGKVEVGENVVAIGSPFGLEATVTSGIVSALNRPVSVGSESDQSGQDTTYPAIQTDAAINPGNSGGPLVDLSGDVIGINSSIRTASSGGPDSSSGGSIGLGFAIPIEQVWPVVQQLRNGEKATHARLGVSVSDAASTNGLLSGAGIESVNQGSAGQKAGLKRGDVVTKVDDQVVTGSDSLVATIRGHRPGDKVTLTVVAGGNKTRTVQVTLDSDGGSASS
ncbi:trypsin-like peptidase domain-containing protein [Nocardioides panacis]|uniref:Trypsin-like peptidase domain-containing protein n=1 Tax=Nocardioides panacis TaxID=2849501 RepID=A0A975XZW7_9ACTN|nr:trypsin-like peptidase domain-containing protein [Nocardioides panacis]QWZ07866.1 trypsin-like peptidase domain-containing protein [Nocardioides panacis]